MTKSEVIAMNNPRFRVVRRKLTEYFSILKEMILSGKIFKTYQKIRTRFSLGCFFKRNMKLCGCFHVIYFIFVDRCQCYFPHLHLTISLTLSDKTMLDKIFVTNKKFRHFCPKLFCPIRLIKINERKTNLP